jgi:hypothetical protein
VDVDLIAADLAGEVGKVGGRRDDFQLRLRRQRKREQRGDDGEDVLHGDHLIDQ